MKNPYEERIKFLEKSIEASEALVQEAFVIKEVLGIAYEMKKDLETLDWIIRIKSIDLETSKENFYNTIKKLLKIQDYKV